VLKWGSALAFGLMVAGIVGLYYSGHLFGRHVWSIAVQVAAIALMISARLTFGMRSFHATANPTEGGIVTTGPYAFIRHPIYAAATYFVWAGALDGPSAIAVAGAALVTIGAALRMWMEEQLLVARYPEYRAYMARVKRFVPYVF
jgi:protein-S-isoprenylcysteine O-methyltransferase Ste14